MNSPTRLAGIFTSEEPSLSFGLIVNPAASVFLNPGINSNFLSNSEASSLLSLYSTRMSELGGLFAANIVLMDVDGFSKPISLVR